MMHKTLIFTGHFDVGERLTESTQYIVDEAKSMNGDIVVLVGDIGVADKIIAYIKDGVNGVVDIYKKRLFSCQSACVLEQLPKHNVENIIDEEFFVESTGFLKEKFPVLFHKIEANSNYNIAEFNRILNKYIIKQAIDKRIKEYDFTNRKVYVYTEKSLRNLVTKRTKIKTNATRTWTTLKSFVAGSNGVYIDGEQIVNKNNNPVCRGIMFAFYEKIFQLNYDSIIHLIEKRHYRSIKKGFDLFQKNYKDLRYLNIKTNISVIFKTYEQSLKQEQMKKEKIYQLVADRNQKRFETHNEYITEKLIHDDFVSNAIIRLSKRLKKYLSENLSYYQNLESIKLLDVGPAHGAIGTCYALAVLDEFNLLDKTELIMVDPVKSVLEDNKALNFPLESSMEIIQKKLCEKNIVSKNIFSNLDAVKRIFNNAVLVDKNIQDVNEGVVDIEPDIDILIYTFTLHHIHPDHKTPAMQKTIDLLKINAFFGFADEWFQDEYFERFIKGRDHLNDPIPFEFPESPEDVVEHFKRRISIYYLLYDGSEAYTITGVKRKKEDKHKTGHFPDFDYNELV